MMVNAVKEVLYPRKYGMVAGISLLTFYHGDKRHPIFGWHLHPS